MRSVKVFKRVVVGLCPKCGDQVVFETVHYPTNKRCATTDCNNFYRFRPDRIDDGTAYFHAWGSEYDEFESGPGNYTVAIIERPDGKVQTIIPELIEFMI